MSTKPARFKVAILDETGEEVQHILCGRIRVVGNYLDLSDPIHCFNTRTVHAIEISSEPVSMDRERWLKEGRKQSAAYLLIVHDTFDGDYYPVYVGRNESLGEKEQQYDGQNSQKVVEVIDLDEGPMQITYAQALERVQELLASADREQLSAVVNALNQDTRVTYEVVA